MSLSGSVSGGGKCISYLMFNVAESWILEFCDGTEYHGIYRFYAVAFDI